MVDNVRVNFGDSPYSIDGPNILHKVLKAAREGGNAIAPLDMELHKVIPPGTGMGAGSGNGAALLTWLARQGYDVLKYGALVGADVPFFCQESPLALVTGIGDRIEPLSKPRLSLQALAVIPSWRCPTAQSFGDLDGLYGSKWPVTESEAKEEAAKVLAALSAGRFYGLLPNDFCSVLMARHGEYAELFEDFSSQGALAWGISGSGSAAFALWPCDALPSLGRKWPWVEKTFMFRTD